MQAFLGELVFHSSRTKACSTEDNIPFPSLANHIVLSKFREADLDRKVPDNYAICIKLWETFMTSKL